MQSKIDKNNKSKQKHKNKKKTHYTAWLLLCGMIFSIVMTIINPLETNVLRPINVNIALADDNIDSPSSWASWTQFNGSWGKQWGEKPGSGNVGCYLTAIAIQGARGGMTKTSSGKEWNPLNLGSAIGAGQCGSTAGNNGFQMKKSVGNFSADFINAGSMGGKDKVNDAINQLTKAGYFPIVHISKGAGYPYETHYMAFRKMDNGNMTLYDPALYQGKQTADMLGGLDKMYPMVAWVEGWGGSPKDYSKADSPAQKGASGQKDEGTNGGETTKDSSSDNSNANVNAYGGGAPIHMEFNPFRTQMNNGEITQIGANTDISPLNNATIMAIKGANWFGLMSKLETFALYLFIFMVAYMCFSILLLLVDKIGLGAVQGALMKLCDKTPFFKKIFFPKGLFMGIVEEGNTFNITVKFAVELLFMTFVLAMTCTGGLSTIASMFFSKFM